jgi:alpha-amylase
MIGVCLYFQVHQPNRLRKYTYFDIGQVHDYEDDIANREILLKVANKCYLPTNALLLKLIKRYPGRFKIGFSISGTIIDQFRQFSPETLDSFKALAETGAVEFLNETYYHSLSCLFSPGEFKEQIDLHHQLIKKEFGYNATTFRNTELIYNNDIAKFIEDLGYATILAEGADKILGWRSSNFVYQPAHCRKIKLLLRNYSLTDDVAFRFSNRGWVEYPLYAEKYAHWLHALSSNAQVINLFMDYETFGEHQWKETGIFEFLEKLPEEIFKHPDFAFMLPHEASKAFAPVATLDVPDYVSWADEERDLTAWRGNSLQEDALQTIYVMEKAVKATHNPKIIHTWRTLLTSDHFYYMCTKFANDGDVHKYFNPYRNPYDAYINFQNIVSDFNLEIQKNARK